MRQLAAILGAVVLLGVGAAIAVACDGGSTDHGNAGHDQYNDKPGCGPWKTDGYAGGSGYHDGQPPKADDRGDCPKPPCDHYSEWSSFTGGSSGDGCDPCDDQHGYSRYSGYSSEGGGGKSDCDRSSVGGPPPVPPISA